MEIPLPGKTLYGDKAQGPIDEILICLSNPVFVFWQRYRKQPYGEEAALSLYRNSKKAFNARQLAALKGLHEWRDSTAREGDESLGWVEWMGDIQCTDDIHVV